MWIILNPAKAYRFTTKGINLHKGSPTAFVDPDLPGEFRAAIDKAIADGRIIRVAGNDMKEMLIPKQAKIETISDQDTDNIVRTKYIKNEEGKVISTVLMMPDEDGNITKQKEGSTGVIITGITESPREEDED